MVGRYSAYRRGPDPVVNPQVIDRIMIGACAAVWLILVGVSVAAFVALADLGRGYHKASHSPHTTWVLYAIIVVSALIIAAAIPVLLRARRMTQAEPVVRSRALQGGGSARQTGRPTGRATPAPAPRESVKAYGALDEWSGETVDRIWLRGTLALTSVIGAALVGVGLATYLMAAGHDGGAWVSYAFAGLIIAGTPAVEWYYVRQLRRGPAAH
ncbi:MULTISPECIES: DUF2561 family protein [Mycobacterium]|uniref:DUF2561 family protein n=1 Tax=Mycobacterium kiyosense TaxID=2871094 RepID=A0A9P3Q8F7_9MYCO|nr:MULTISPECIES: DUF2561 family protein [Mycobacterium]BDB42043.1 hypothetical protein IWGMT90018_24890 [Mycobacterium kiyosense]BDE14676.1 hypothetical protein MKCMC460_35360 [Mycobacterium sp. 20KCMC460]GLB81361.1 hypothetical protein SRL2020028_06170 [Mycobacterium kiyosense]GLB90743.1 hypothetical protein SRL2020130_35600 [Mycobacterium kiyosense]GLB96166.1 hypothetical protein SRL2020226_29420 [Mycobacterium kiyosense]